MKIIKDGSASGSVCAEQELQAINAFAKTQLTADEVYAFQVLLCDNEVDRDFERFSVSTLRELSELFVGATGICDHDWRSENQVARIYRTELVTEKGKTTSCGEAYVYLKGFAYMLRTEANAELIAQIEGGIKRETSVGCSVAQSICSICGAEIGTCSHEKGKVYGGERCCAVLTGAVMPPSLRRWRNPRSSAGSILIRSEPRFCDCASCAMKKCTRRSKKACS